MHLNETNFSHQLLMRIPCIEKHMEKNTKISDMTWNSNGTVLAISFYIDNHIGPCSHTSFIYFYKFTNINESKSFSSKISLDTNACIKSIDSHPTLGNLFVAASYIGEIYLINISNTDKDLIDCISKIDSYFHKECVVSVKWIKYEEGVYVIFLTLYCSISLHYQKKAGYFYGTQAAN